MEGLTVDEMVMVYRKIRDAKSTLDKEFKEKLAALDAQLDTISGKLVEMCEAQGVESMRTANGTVTLTTKTRYWTSDWESMYDFIKEHDAFNLLQQRIHDGNMRNFLDENPELLPVGLNADRKYQVTVRKPTGK